MKKFLTVFAGIYAWLYMFPQPFDEMPLLGDLLGYYHQAVDWLAIWFGKTVFNLPDLKKIEMTGSGDTTLEYVKIPLKLLLSLGLAAVFTTFLGRNEQGLGLFNWLTRSYIRWYLALYMIIYGVAKVVEGGQFTYPEASQLATAYGDSSPMGLLWRFMGFSHTYAAFTGLLEILAGLLLFFRQTTVLGALMTIGVMSNVFMLNMCYDVPVKLFSFHLIVLASVLLIPNLRPVYQFFVKGESATPNIDPERMARKWMVTAKNVVKGLLIAGLFGATVYFGFFPGAMPDETDETPLKGAYQVESFVLKNAEVPLDFRDSVRWSKAFIAHEGFQVVALNGQKKYYGYAPDSLLANFVLKNRKDSLETNQFRIVGRDSSLLTINGIWKGDSLRVRMRRMDESKFLLNNRGFHWVSEYPFNR